VQSIAYGDYYLPAEVNSAHIYIHGNNISLGGRFVVYGWTGHVVDDVEVYANRMQGSGGTPLGGYHLDGLMIGNPTSDCTKPPAGSPLVLTPTVTHIAFHDNYFNGDWPGGPTALYFSSSCTNYTTIYNNVFALETVDPKYVGYIMRWQSHDGNISILNNTFSSDANPGFEAGAEGAITLAPTYQAHYGTLVIENNIFSDFGMDLAGIVPSNWSSVAIDYNLHNISTAHGYGDFAYLGNPIGTASTQCKTLACVQKTWGYETHSLAAAPKFVAVPNGKVGSGDFYLLSGSPALGTGISLSSVFTTDAAGNPRPSAGSWDMGAFVESTF
jgi:hypothetical protein